MINRQQIKLEDWSHLAQIASAFLVVVSLFYVAYEVRQNTNAIRSATHQGLLTLMWEKGSWIVQNADAAQFLLKAAKSYRDLSEEEKLRFDYYIGRHFDIWEYAYKNYKAGTIDKAVWDGFDRFFRGKLTHQVSQDYWNGRRTYYSEDFQKHVGA